MGIINFIGSVVMLILFGGFRVVLKRILVRNLLMVKFIFNIFFWKKVNLFYNEFFLLFW